jgi:SAM-dependent methyltransferase
MMPAPASSAAGRARAENAASYPDAERVGSYVLDSYHAVRRELAVLAITEAVDDAAFPAGPFLEIGASGSSLFGSLPDLHRTLIVADISRPALRECKDGINRPVVLDADQPLPFADGALAVVMVGELIEHLFDPAGFLREVRRVLAPGGVVVLTTPNLAGLQDRLHFLIGRSPRQVNPLHEYLHLHIRPFTAEMLKLVIVDSGLVPTSLRSNFVGWQHRSGRWRMSRRLARVFPGWGGSLIAAARKP